MRWNKHGLAVLATVVLCLGVVAQQAHAAEPTIRQDEYGNWFTPCYNADGVEQECLYYWPKGIGYGSNLENGWDDIVISTSAWFTKTAGRGWEEIRVWDRRSHVQTYFDAVHPGWLVLGVSQVNVRLYKSDTEETDPSGYTQFIIWDEKVHPAASWSPSSIPPDDISAGLLIGPVTHISETGNPWDMTIKIFGPYGAPLASGMELPASYAWNEADQALSDGYSGLETRFGYDLQSYGSFELWPQAMLWYQMAEFDGWEWNYWETPSGVASVKHLVKNY